MPRGHCERWSGSRCVGIQQSTATSARYSPHPVVRAVMVMLELSQMVPQEVSASEVEVEVEVEVGQPNGEP